MFRCFKQQKYEPGNFSFITSNSLKSSLTYDYKYCFHHLKCLNGNEDEYFQETQRRSIELDRENPPSLWDTPPGYEWNQVLQYAYPAHTKKSYSYNMKILIYIKKYGWDSFCKRYIKGKQPFNV